MSAGFELSASPGLADWLIAQGCSLALTTHLSGHLLMVGTRTDGRLQVTARRVERAMGLCFDHKALWVAGQHEVHRLQLTRAKESAPDAESQARFIRRLSYVTGALDAHDLGVDEDGRPCVVATRRNLVLRIDTEGGLNLVWRPPWLDADSGEDCCHLNGLGMRDGQPRYLTCVSQSTRPQGWREEQASGGVVIDRESNEVLARGLSMPHSPRWHDGRLWLLEAGSGHLGFVDLESGRFERVAFCPGFTRGLSMGPRFAVVAHSAARWNPAFSELALRDELDTRGLTPVCGLSVVELSTGQVVEWIRIEGEIREIFDVARIPGVGSPGLEPFNGEATRAFIPMV